MRRKKNPCDDCDARCCRYFALQIDTPRTKADFDDIRWYLAHEGTRVFVEGGKWFLEVANRCRHLDENNRCRIYPDRPTICREHDPARCERTDLEFAHEREFRSDEELVRYVAWRWRGRKKKARRKKK